MTIGACYVSAEGVVLGADSTSTVYVPGPPGVEGHTHHFNFAQKLFEFGEAATLGIVTWGLGSVGELSHRTLIAEIADECAKNEGTLTGVDDVAKRFSERFHAAYCREYKGLIAEVRSLNDKGEGRSEAEEGDFQRMMESLPVGFCLGGWWAGRRHPAAYEMLFDPLADKNPEPQQIPPGSTRFWGCPSLMDRIIYGADMEVCARILASGNWQGTPDDLLNTLDPCRLAQPFDLPIREAIDWIHAIIYTTIKAMKFSHLAPVCGGLVEVAVITSDRRFRWVSHKTMGEAVLDVALPRGQS